MSGFALYDVQKAVDSILIADSTLTDMLGDGVNGIVDNGIQTTALTFPYMVYATNFSKPFDTKDTNGAETILTISIYSKTGDKEEVGAIMNRVHVLLHNADLTVSNNSHVLCRWDDLAEILVDDSDQGRINQGVIRFRVLTTQS